MAIVNMYSYSLKYVLLLISFSFGPIVSTPMSCFNHILFDAFSPLTFYMFNFQYNYLYCKQSLRSCSLFTFSLFTFRFLSSKICIAVDQFLIWSYCDFIMICHFFKIIKFISRRYTNLIIRTEKML
jgi:hypothetical protein